MLGTYLPSVNLLPRLRSIPLHNPSMNRTAEPFPHFPEILIVLVCRRGIHAQLVNDIEPALLVHRAGHISGLDKGFEP